MQPAVVDFETFGIEERPHYPPVPVGVAIKLPGQPSRYYAWGHREGNTCTYQEAAAALAKAWRCKDGVLFHNASFDLAVARVHFDLPLPKTIHDTMVLLFLDNPHRRSFGLKQVCAEDFQLAPDEQDAVREWLLEHQPVPGITISKAPKGKHPAGAYTAWAPPSVVGPYAEGDTDRTWLLFQALHEQVYQRGMGAAYEREMALMACLLDMEAQGVAVDTARLEADIAAYEAVDAQLRRWVYQRLGQELNIDSGKELVTVLLAQDLLRTEEMGLTPKKGDLKTDMANLQAGLKDPQLAAVLRYLSQLGTCLGTFMKPWHRVARKSGGRIFTAWHQTRGDGHGARTGRLSSTPNCLTGDTEVFSRDGWVRLDELDPGVEVLQWAKDFSLTFVTPEIVSKPFVGKMVEFSQSHHKLTYTPDHRVPGFRIGRGWKDYLAGDLLSKNFGFRIPVSGNYSGGKGLFSSLDEARFFVALRADGSFYLKSPSGLTARFQIKKSRKRERLEALCRRLGLNFEVTPSTEGRVYYKVYGFKPLSAIEFILRDHGTKRYRSWVLDLGTEERKIMVEEERYWDGTESKLSYRWGTADREEMEWFQTMAHLSGEYSVNYSRIKNFRGYNKNPDAVFYAATCKPRNFITFDNSRPPSEIDFDGTVWCLKVPSSYFLVRRSGRILVTGNCQNIPKEFKPIFGHEQEGLPPAPVQTLPLPKVRSYIVPFEGDVLIGRDFHSQELRVLAHFIEGALLEAYRQDPWLDVHEWARQTVNKLLHSDYGRKPIKNLGFSVLYGAGLPKIASQLQCSMPEAKQLLATYLTVFPGLKELYNDMRYRAKTNTPIRTWGGREVYCEPPAIVNGRVMQFDYKLVNFLIQASSADVTKEAVVAFYAAKKPQWKLILQVHDELVVSVPAAERDEAMECLRQAMLSPQLDVPMLSDGKYSELNWASMIDFPEERTLA